MTTTSLEIFPPDIHLFNCDMIFLIYAFTWSSADTTKPSISSDQTRHSEVGIRRKRTEHVEAIFLDAEMCQLLFLTARRGAGDLRRKIFWGVDPSLEAIVVVSFDQSIRQLKIAHRIELIEYSNYIVISTGIPSKSRAATHEFGHKLGRSCGSVSFGTPQHCRGS